MKSKSMLTKVLMLVSSALMLAAAGGGNAYAGLVSPGSGLTQADFTLPGIGPAGFPNFENTVNVKVQKRGKNGFKLKVRKEGKGHYFNLSDSERLKIQNGKYFLDAYFDTSGNFLNGTLKIKGLLDTPLGTAKGTLMTANLGSGLGGIDFAYTSTLLGFNTNNIVCDSIIDDFIGGCTPNESVIIALQESGFSPTTKNFKSDGLSVATVPVPAAVWLFGSGLIALVGITRRRKY